MREVLIGLNSVPGITGSLVVTHDGIVVVSELANTLDEETTAAYIGNVVTRTLNLLEGGDYEALDRMVLRASRGKIVIEQLENCMLVVLTNQFVDLDFTLLEIQSAAKKIASLGRLGA